MNLDLWYQNKPEDITRITIFFNDIDAKYWGNCYIGEKIVGDYTADSFEDVEKTFPHLSFDLDMNKDSDEMEM